MCATGARWLHASLVSQLLAAETELLGCARGFQLMIMLFGKMKVSTARRACSYVLVAGGAALPMESETAL